MHRDFIMIDGKLKPRLNPALSKNTVIFLFAQI